MTRPLDLKTAQWPALLILWQEDGLTQTELATRCSIEHYTTTRILNTLETQGLITRKPQPTSRRAYLIYLIDLGASLKTMTCLWRLHCLAGVKTNGRCSN